MALINNDGLHLEQVVLHHVRYAVTREIPLGPAAMDSMEFYKRVSDFSQSMVIGLATDIQAQHLQTKAATDTQTVEFSAPTTWFDHLRHDLADYQCRRAFSNCPVVRWYAQVLLFICWILRPPAYTRETKTVTLRAEVAIDALFPESSIIAKHDYLGKPIVVQRIVRQETETS